MRRIQRIAGSFAIVMVAYWAYALVALPLIEPSAKLTAGQTISDEERAAAGKLVDMQINQIKGLFQPDAWELQDPIPIIIEINRAKLLFKEYQNLPNGCLKIKRCTIVFTHEGAADDEQQRLRQAVILEAPGGAVLQFDQPLDLNRGKISRLIGGRLNGNVKIRSDCKEKGPQDDLDIVTSNVQLSEQTISTPEPVNFRWGPHFGSGRDMTIQLLSGQAKPGESGPNIAGIKSFELAKLDRLHIDFGQTMSASNQPMENTPVEVNCRGPFRFDAVNHVATFNDGVDVLKSNPSGPSDQIVCDTLSLFFIPRAKDAEIPPTKPNANAPASFDLTAKKIEAVGRPAVVTAPSRNVVSRAGRFEYDIVANSLRLEDPRESSLQQGPNEIHAPMISYQAAASGRLGMVVASGPGWLQGQTPDRPDQQLKAVWKEKFEVAPDGKHHRISLTRGGISFNGVGQLEAREIFFWLMETPPAVAGQQSQLVPAKMLAKNEVHLNSPQLSGTVEQFEAWFEQASGQRRPPAGPVAGSIPQTAAPAPPIAGVNQPTPPQQQGPLQRYDVSGRLLQVKLLMADQQASVSHLTIEDGVKFVELQADRPLTITGDRLVAGDPTGAGGTVTIIGRPARFEGAGLGLTGANINLNRAENRLWIDGPGSMDAPISGAIPGQNQSVPGVLTVGWRRKMEFNGQTASFEDGVVASTAQQQLRTAAMSVHMLRPIVFGEQNSQNPQGQPQVDEIRCVGGVQIENRDFNEQRQLIRYDRLEVTDLAVKVLSGAMTAGGPGWLNSVGRGNPMGSGSIGFGAAPANPPVNAPVNPNQLTCLHVRFQKNIIGSIPPDSLWSRKVTFSDRVRMAIAPVSDWDAMLSVDNPDILGPQGAVARCQQLSVVDMPAPFGQGRSVEFVALENAVVENSQYTARGYSIAYNQAKEMLILEGGGRNDAELFMQQGVGAPPSQYFARKITYWLKDKKVKTEGARMFEMVQPPAAKKSR